MLGLRAGCTILSFSFLRLPPQHLNLMSLLSWLSLGTPVASLCCLVIPEQNPERTSQGNTRETKHAGQRPFFCDSDLSLREVGEAIQQYDEHFWRNGHSVRMIVFDDSSPANQEKYYPSSNRPGPTTICITSAPGRKSNSSAI